ncbi:MAG: beta-glucuronidase, partial [Clostridia bacterium]|nr:beta-glucuronidase [Clostridia bacterium]
MKRLFNEHFIRKETCLNGAWNLVPDYDNVGLDEGWANGLPNDKSRKTLVPGVWNLEPELFHHFGVCWYEKEVVTSSRALFYFGAVTGQCTVYLDGKEL